MRAAATGLSSCAEPRDPLSHPGMCRPLLMLTLVSALACGDDTGAARPDDAGERTPVDLGVDVGSVDMHGPDADLGPDAETCAMPGGTLGRACFRNADCNDFCYCNGTERCRGGLCAAGDPPCEDEFACTFRACDERDDRCGDLVLLHDACDDGDRCTVNRCDINAGCVERPLNCSDGDSCSIDSCDPELGCVNRLRDLDGDGFPDARCTTGLDADCRDDRPDINPGATEICNNLEDDDCDGQADIFDPDCAPTNDTCSTAIELASSGFFGFATTGLVDDYESRCALRGFDPADVVFFFDVLDPSDLMVEVADALDNTVVELRGPGDVGVCEDDARASAEEVPCDRSFTGYLTSHAATVEQERLAPGRYYLIVRTPSESVGSFEFRLSSPPPPPRTNSCRTAPTIVAPGGIYAEDMSRHRDAHDSPSCGSPDAEPDACYVLDLAVSQDVTLSADFFFGSGARGPGAVTVTDDFDDVVRTERGCASGVSPDLLLRSLAAGTYYILLERTSSAVEGYALVVTLSEGVLPDCDLCRNACTAAPPRAGGTPRTVDLSLMALDEPTLGCTLSAGAQNDSFFTFETTVPNERVGLTIGAPGVFAYSVDDAGRCPATTAPICHFGGVLGAVSTTVTMPAVGTHTLAIQTGVRSGNLTVEIDPTGAPAP